MALTPIESLVVQWKDDPGGTYRNWFPVGGPLKEFSFDPAGSRADRAVRWGVKAIRAVSRVLSPAST